MTDTSVRVQNHGAATDFVLPVVPLLEAPTPRGALTVVMPVVMLAGTVGFVVMGGGSTTSLLMGGLMAMSLIGMILGGGGRQVKPAAAVAAERGQFLRSLADLRGRLIDRETTIRRDAHRRHPGPDALTALARNPRSGVAAPTAGSVRLGVGPVPAVVPLTVPVDDPDTAASREPFAAAARQRLAAAHDRTEMMPWTVDLWRHRRLRLTGSAATDLARAVVLQLCLGRSPRDCRVAVWAEPGSVRDWEWTKWLPHTGHPARCDVLGAVRMITDDVADIHSWAADLDPAVRWVLIVVGRPSAATDALRRDGVFGPDLVLIEVAPLDVPVGVTDGWEVTTTTLRRTGAAESGVGNPDLVGAATATAVARQLAGRSEPAGGAPSVETTADPADLAGLLGFGAAGDFRPERHQRPLSGSARLRVPIGVDESGSPVLLDLKQAAEGGVGPHGLLIGATGSGKSELLRTLVLALAATHTSRSLNFVLVDFKGGAGFLGLRDLPHVAAVITNLADEQALVERMQEALTGEVNRRQELLRAAGNLASAAEYERARRRDPDLPPLPALLVVCDEFTEMLVQHPDLAQLFVMLGRLGRSLSIHLLMASQRMEEGRMQGLDAHLSYRVALKTFSAADSRAVLEVDDAYRLPTTPGVGYLKSGASAPQRFRAAYVSEPPPAAAPATGPRMAARSGGTVRLFTSATVPGPSSGPTGVVGREPVGPAGATSTPTATVLDLWVDRLRGRGAPAHPVWLPPLDVPPLLDELTVDGACPKLRVPVGVVDRPLDQRRDLLWADFTGSTGHGLVVGGARAGKSTLLAGIVLALAAAHRPDEVHCYVIDLGGGAVSEVRGLPHVGGVADRTDPGRVRRTVAQLGALLAARESASSRNPTDRAAPWPEVFLVVDGWASFRTDFEDLEAGVTALVQRGLAYGIHVVLSLSRWAEIRPALKDLMGSRFELRLGDPAESEVDRHAAARVPSRSPGRGVTTDGHHFLTAVPGRVGDRGAVARLVAVRRADWAGPDAPVVRMLPDRVTVAELGPGGADPLTVPIGLGEADLATVAVGFGSDPHLLVWGDGGSGRSSFLRALAAGLVARSAPADLKFLVIDPRRALLDAVPPAHLAGHAGTATAAAALIADVVALMRSRLPAADVTAAQLRDRSWWSGAELFVLVDDHELLAAAGDPLDALVDLLPHARDIGLHLVVCRRASGGGRAGYEPVLRQLRELGAPGLVMSGPPDEGALHGSQRARSLPPGRAFWVTRGAPTQLVQLAVTGDGSASHGPVTAG